MCLLLLTLTALHYKNLNLYPLEVVSRYRNTQLQVGENYKYLYSLHQNISQSSTFNVHLSFVYCLF